MVNVITHGGTFHADEVFAIAILEYAFGNVNVSRVFEVPEKLTNDTIVLDIGGGKYDHHQKGGNGVRENGVPYASAGLIWKAYAKLVMADSWFEELDEKDKNDVFEWIDRDLIQGIDAVDNGVMPKADYPAKAMNISNIIADFNPNWDSNESSDEAFEDAISMAMTIMYNCLDKAISKAKARKIVEKAIVEKSDNVMIMEKFVPWQEFVFSSENPEARDIWYVVFPSNRGGWNVQAVPNELGSFQMRKPLPENWRGLQGEALEKETGVADATFCHRAGFLASASSFEAAKSLAILAAKS